MVKIVCDLCGNEVEPGTEHYEMMIGKKPKGFDINADEDFPVDVELYHVCPDCVGAWADFMNGRKNDWSVKLP